MASPEPPSPTASVSEPTVDGPSPNEEPTVRLGMVSAAMEPPSRRYFGGYELIGEIGRGGMGVVYKARQCNLDRLVALKMIISGPLAQHTDLHRFRIEAEAMGRLNHPNITSIHEVGEIDGQHFYSMDFIAGPSLSQKLARGPLPGRTAARYVLTIARAIHHAHQHGILHRDLKPSNILIDADDQPHVLDFGLAKRVGDAGMTHTGTVMGTPSYMAPEQAAGKVRELGPTCDVYSLGAVLYELITGRPPFRCESALDTIKHVLEKDPAAPRLLNPTIEHDLETIVLKCLEKDPKLRYESAAVLADDLQRYLNGESIDARSFNVLDRLAHTLERSQHAVEFRGWGNMLFLFAAIVFVGHLATFLLIKSDQPQPWHWLARAGQFAVMGLVFWRYRTRTFLPTSLAERQLWSIWIAYLLAYAATVVVAKILIRQQLLHGGIEGSERWQEMILYPSASILTGVAFFVMGSSYWGRCYAFGLAFFALAALMPFHPEFGPLMLGTLWSIVLVTIGLHLRQMSGPVE